MLIEQITSLSKASVEAGRMSNTQKWLSKCSCFTIFELLAMSNSPTQIKVSSLNKVYQTEE